MIVYVETGEDGQPEHVFLETGCDDRKINDDAVKLVGKGRNGPTPAPNARVVSRSITERGRDKL